MRPERPSRTCARVVALTRPEGLADGAASGPPKASRRRWASGCDGTRIATVARPAVARGLRPKSGRRGRTRVRGPGQKRSARARASGGKLGEALGGGPVGDVDDERVEGRAALGGEDAGDRGVAPGVGAEAVDGLGREGHELAGAEERGGGAEAARAVRERDGVAGHRLTRRPGCGGGRGSLTSPSAGPASSRSAAPPPVPGGRRHELSCTRPRDALPPGGGAGRRPAGGDRALRRGDAGDGRGGAGRGGAAGGGRAGAAAPRRRPRGGAAGERRGSDDAGLCRGLPEAGGGRLGRPGGGPGDGRDGAAGDGPQLPQRDVLGREPGAGALPAADAGADRGAGASRQRRGEGASSCRSWRRGRGPAR